MSGFEDGGPVDPVDRQYPFLPPDDARSSPYAADGPYAQSNPIVPYNGQSGDHPYDGLREAYRSAGESPSDVGEVVPATDSPQPTPEATAVQAEGGEPDGDESRSYPDGIEPIAPPPAGYHEEQYSDAPPAGDVPAGPPPTLPPTAEDTPEVPDDPGEALEQLLDYAATSATKLTDRLRDYIATDDEREAILGMLIIHEGLSEQEALATLGESIDDLVPGEQRISDTVKNAEETDTSRRYGGAMEAAGVRLVRGDEGFELEISDIAAFAEAVQHLAPTGEQGGIVVSLLAAAYEKAADTVMQDHFQDAVDMAGDALQATYTAPTEQERDFARSVFRHAADIDHALAHMPPEDRRIPQLFAQAEQEGLTPEAAVGYLLTVFDTSVGPIGVDRLTEPVALDAVRRYVEHLNRVAPPTDSSFTRQINTLLLSELQEVIDLGPEWITPEAVETSGYEDGRPRREQEHDAQLLSRLPLLISLANDIREIVRRGER
ncbi:MAG TPA: hypothetical protein VKQ34_00195 [Candidatus Saccharimonadales bacterium]|nr:hypothetical protein [Candidatus Saccharimonadales bacterium]